MVRWLDEIEEFHFDAEHVPGKLNRRDPFFCRGLPALARPSRTTAFADARAKAKASDLVVLVTAPSALVTAGGAPGEHWRGPWRLMCGPSRRSTAHVYSSLRVIPSCHPPNPSPSSTPSPRSSWPQGSRRCSQTPCSPPPQGVLRVPWQDGGSKLIECSSRWSRRPLDRRAAPSSCIVACSIDAVRERRIASATRRGQSPPTSQLRGLS